MGDVGGAQQAPSAPALEGVDHPPELAQFLSGWKSELQEVGAAAAVPARVLPGQAAATTAAGTRAPPDSLRQEAPHAAVVTRPVGARSTPQSPFELTFSLGGRGVTGVADAKRARVHEAGAADEALGPTPTGTAHDDLVQELIDDLDEENDVPMLDFVLPRDVAMRILSSLDVVTLCRVACASRLWRDLASDNVVWFGVCRGMRYCGELPPFAAVASWKARAAGIALRRREIDRRWKEMEAAFTQLEHMSELRLLPLELSATAFAKDGGCLAGYADGSIVGYDADGATDRYYYTGEGKRVVSLTEGGCTVAAVSSTTSAVANANHPLDFLYELEVWGGVGGGDRLFQAPIGERVDHDDKASWAGVHAHRRNPTVFAATSTVLQCYSAVHTGSWERAWSAPNVVGLRATELVHDTTLACLTTTGVVLRSCRSGEIVANLYDTSQVGGTCDIVATGNGHILFGATDATIDRASLRVCRDDTGIQSGSLDVGRRSITSIATAADDPALVAVTTQSSSTVRIYDLRTEAAVQSFMDIGGARSRITCQAVAWESWRLATGGSCGTAGTVAVFDRRMERRLWYIDLASPILDVQVQRDGATLWASSATRTRCQPTRRASCLTVLDFAAPPAALAEATCPFSSSFDNVHGNRYDELLAAPYDDVVNPDALG